MGRYFVSISFTYERAVCHLEVKSQNGLKRKLVPKWGLNRYNSVLNELIDIQTRRDN